ncbi:MAG: glycosyltransferase family 2 protein [Spirochaetaceae bacterium]|jgi:glycosyltransferase involved in cell wall biosynthesis|nr:glycosyltransferase family 2 protein [Spirochaetaceae bacterium]
MHKFSVITPTFNRAAYIQRIYDCLMNQGENDFEWIIIDDGSTDETESVVLGFDKIFDIKYIYQNNAGKQSAVNKGVDEADSYLSVILDSDDILLHNVLATVWNYFNVNDMSFENNCVSLSGLSRYSHLPSLELERGDGQTLSAESRFHAGEIIGDKFPSDYFISDHISCRYNMRISGDKCEFYITHILKKYPFPIFINEKFITEAVVWNRIAKYGKTLYINSILQEKMYLPSGLSSDYEGLLLNNPQGTELFYNEATIPKFKLRLQIEHSAKYIFFAKKNRRKHIIAHSKNKKICVLAFCLYYVPVIKLLLPCLQAIYRFIIPKNIRSFIWNKRTGR